MFEPTIKFLESEVQCLQNTLAKRELEIIKLKVEMAEMEERMKTMNKRIDKAFMAASKIIGEKWL